MPAARDGLVVFAITVAMACSGRAQDDEPTPLFQLVASDGASHRGSLQQLDQAGNLDLAGDKSTTWSVRQWLSLRRDRIPLPPHPSGKQIVFANGDRLPLADAKRLRLVDNRLQFHAANPLRAQPDVLSPPLPAVALVWLGGPDGAEEPERLLRKLLASRPRKDVVVLKDGERVEGSVVALDSDDGCRVQVGKRRVDLAWAQIAAIAFNSDLLYAKIPDRPHYHLVLTNGTRLGLDKARVDKGSNQLQGTTLFGAAVEVALTEIVTVDVRGGTATYLSDLKPLKYEHTPFAGTSWPLVQDGSVSGDSLRLAGSTFDKGLGLHSECRVSYDLGGKYRWFEAQVGLDPQKGQGGRVRLRVLVDGKERDLGWNKELTGADGVLVLRLDVSKAREMVLEVLFGTRGDVQAHVNWAEARLLD
jgi:hypothetical protein